MVATIGICAGLHNYIVALGATVLTLAVLLVLAWFERRVGARDDRTGHKEPGGKR